MEKFATVDEFVNARVLPEHREIVAALRKLMAEAARTRKNASAMAFPPGAASGFSWSSVREKKTSPLPSRAVRK